MQQGQIDDLGFCPSFNCYTSATLASTAAARISSQLQQQQQQHADDDEFQFSFVTGDTNSDSQTSFPLFNSDLLIQNEPVPENEIASAAGEIESASSSSSESDGESPGVFCVWRHKIDAGAVSSPLSKCKKSSSTGSGSKRWRIRDLLRRSNSEGKEPMVLLTHNKKVETPKQNGSSADVSTVAGKLKPLSPSVHELLYVQQRTKREGGKRKSYLPYRQGLVGFFSNVNGWVG